MSEPRRRQVLVIGLGNPIMGDDGLGIAALERLGQMCTLPETVHLVDGGTWGMNLLPLIEEAGEIVLLDAIDNGLPPGELIVLEREQVPRLLGLKLSPHQVDLREVLALAELRGSLPERLVAVGLQPRRVEMCSSLSPDLQSRLDELVVAVMERLAQWGHPVLRRLEPLTSA